MSPPTEAKPAPGGAPTSETANASASGGSGSTEGASSQGTVKAAAAGAAAGTDPTSALRAESGRYRTQRNASLKRESALRAALEAHGVDPDEALQRSDISGLTIKDGAVQGEVEYRAPEFPSAATGATAKPAEAGSSAGLTMDDIRKMDRTEISARWDEVQKVYRADAEAKKRARLRRAS